MAAIYLLPHGSFPHAVRRAPRQYSPEEPHGCKRGRRRRRYNAALLACGCDRTPPFPDRHGPAPHPRIPRSAPAHHRRAGRSRARDQRRHSRRLLDDMFETMYEAPGIGLAASQVDVHQRFMVIDVSEEHDEPLVFINPEITAARRRAGLPGRLPVGARHLRRRDPRRPRSRSAPRPRRPAASSCRPTACWRSASSTRWTTWPASCSSTTSRRSSARWCARSWPSSGARPRPDERLVVPSAAHGTRALRLAHRERIPLPAREAPSLSPSSSLPWRIRPMRIVFAGTPDFAVPCLRAAAQRNEVVAVYTQPDRPAGRGRELTPSPVKREALLRGIAVLQPENFKSAVSQGRAARAAAGPDGRGRLRPDPAAVGARHSAPTAAGTCMPRCCRAGAARRRSSARSRPATARSACA